MKKISQPYPVDVLCGINAWMIVRDESRSTINRKIKSGEIPKPDVPATGNGNPNKWFKSTIDKYMESLKAGVAA